MFVSLANSNRFAQAGGMSFHSDLIRILRELEPSERAKMGIELLEVARAIIFEAEQSDASLQLLSQRAPQICEGCPLMRQTRQPEDEPDGQAS